MSEQKPLNVLLDEIEDSDGWTLSLLIETNAKLVKALRRAIQFLNYVEANYEVTGVKKCSNDIAAILNGEETDTDKNLDSGLLLK